ncbi:MAG: ABC transporter permease [Lachnospiraceae bacterium]
MAIVKYALREVKKHPGKYLPIYAQIIVSILLFSSLAAKFYQVNLFSQQVMHCTEQRNMYVTIDKSDVVTIMNTLSTDESSIKCKELYQYITKQATVYIHMTNKVIWNGQERDILQVNQSFCDLYDLDVIQGRMFYEEELKEVIDEKEVIPVLIGEKLAEQYTIGTTFVNEALDKSTFEIVGILEPNSFYLNPSIDYQTISLDSSFVVPWVPREAFNNGYQNINLFHVLQIETDNPEVLERISVKSKELGLFDLEFVSFQEQLELVETYYQTVYSRDYAMLILLLLYCIVGSVTMLLQYINTHMRYGSIHILCGATQRQMGLQMLVHMSVPILIGWLLTGVILKNIFAVGASILFGIILLGIILAIPAFVWNRLQVSELFKQYE